MEKLYFIIDFDSTFVQVESLDELAKIALRDNPEAASISAQTAKITQLGMEGKIGFGESLKARLGLFHAHHSHVEVLIDLLREKVTSSVIRNREFFRVYAENIYIISGGFRECIIPIVGAYGINEDHIFANTFVFDELGYISGIDENNFLAHTGGKVSQVRALHLSGEIIAIGDGYTDYEIREQGAAHAFYAFIENRQRQPVIEKADFVISSFDELIPNLSLREYSPT